MIRHISRLPLILPLLFITFTARAQTNSLRLDHAVKIASIEQRLASTPGLYVTGSGFRAIGIPDCIADGRETATKAAEFLATKGTKTF